jgi:hypothetical protein
VPFNINAEAKGSVAGARRDLTNCSYVASVAVPEVRELTAMVGGFPCKGASPELLPDEGSVNRQAPTTHAWDPVRTASARDRAPASAQETSGREPQAQAREMSDPESRAAARGLAETGRVRVAAEESWIPLRSVLETEGIPRLNLPVGKGQGSNGLVGILRV